jgi:adenylate kinase
MKTILVVGDSESGKDDLIEFVLNRGQKVLPNYGYLKFDEYLLRDTFRAYDKGLIDIKKFQKDFHKKVTDRFMELRKKHRNIIINAQFFAQFRHGFISLVNNELFNTFKPDAIIVIELYPRKLDTKYHLRFKNDPIDLKKLRLEQEINRKFATIYTSSNETLLRFVQVEKHNVNEAFNEIMHTVKFILED